MGLDFNDFLDYQRNPFTRTTYYTSVVDESHVIISQLGGYMVKLYHAPRETAPSSVMITIGGVPLQEVPSTVTPADMQFRVWYDEDGLGWVDFNADQDGETVLCSYEHYGTMHSKASISSAFQIKEIVYDSITWQNAITRVSANVYKFRDDITNIYFSKNDYDIDDILSGGDTWGQLQTNNIINFYMEYGTSIYVGDTISYFHSNTDNSLINNLYVKGLGSSAVDISYSIYNSGNNVQFYNCKVSDRYNQSVHSAFLNSTQTIALTCAYINCVVDNCSGLSGSIYAYNTIYNGVNLSIINCDTYLLIAYSGCVNCSNIKIYNNTVAYHTSKLFESCTNITNIYMLVNTFNDITQYFASCYQISNVQISNNTHTSGVSIFYSSFRIDNVYINGNAFTSWSGFASCKKVSNSYIYNNTGNSSSACNGFILTTGIINCEVNGITNSGSGAGYGFINCNKMQQNISTGNKTAAYSSCYADAATSNACADTAAGGYNS